VNRAPPAGDRRQSGATIPRRPCRPLPVETDGFSLGSVLLVLSGLFCLTTLFFGTKGGYYDTDDYDGNGTAH
jgi:hypothetical protein